MNRRGFLGLIGGVAAIAAERTFPFRVFSFPTEIKIAKATDITFDVIYYDRRALDVLKEGYVTEHWKGQRMRKAQDGGVWEPISGT